MLQLWYAPGITDRTTDGSHSQTKGLTVQEDYGGECLGGTSNFWKSWKKLNFLETFWMTCPKQGCQVESGHGICLIWVRGTVPEWLSGDQKCFERCMRNWIRCSRDCVLKAVKTPLLDHYFPSPREQEVPLRSLGCERHQTTTKRGTISHGLFKKAEINDDISAHSV